ncbi:MAG: adenylosuccinate lyase [Actinomycetaceae bacterium]|nr:adenylosuccinate lyase [Actinomycetaceae bacterium]MDY6083373.1 adenylosuccinate lyase [Actinomycetaceae bacterium]
MVDPLSLSENRPHLPASSSASTQSDDEHGKYSSPLASRYASDGMVELFSPRTRIETWRQLWVSLAKAESKLGLPVTPSQVEELEKHVTDIDWEAAAEREAQVRHDVMAHVYAFGRVAPSAAGIIHLGATSCYVTDNADLVIYRRALAMIRLSLTRVIGNLALFAQQYKSMPTLGYTHFQPAQLVTVGKRATLWAQDLLADLDEIDWVSSSMRFLGCRGTTGTEASFVELFEGDTSKIDQMNRMIADDFGFEHIFDVCGQTYPRKFDSRILGVLSSIAQSCYRMAEDIRLLQHDRQVEEPFEATQIGSSAMPYKRNPMRCERICSLARYVVADYQNGAMTAMTQWLERTLDDSANRRISVPEAFLAVDAILQIATNVTNGLHVNEKIVARGVHDYLPFIATENILMEGVKHGGDRQQLHEIIREESMAATEKMKNGKPFDLLAALAAHPEFGMDAQEFESVMDPSKYIGRCPEQVEAFVSVVRARLGDVQAADAQLTV